MSKTFKITIEKDCNFRKESAKGNNVIAVLKQGTILNGLLGKRNSWLQVKHNNIVGWIHESLAKIECEFNTPTLNYPIAELETSNLITIHQTHSRAYSLTIAKTFSEDKEIIDFLKVTTAKRYKAMPTQTFCNVATHDFARLKGAYLPRVWWNDTSLQKIKKSEKVTAKYNKTVKELNANELFDWLKNIGSSFGFTEVANTCELQYLVDKGYVGIITAKNKNLSKSGHITMCVKNETNKDLFVGNNFIPLQWQAGRVNKEYFVDNWYQRNSFSDFAFFVI